MTGMALLFGLIPIMWSGGAGADVMKRIAAPMVGGITSALIMVLVVFPAIFAVWKERGKKSINWQSLYTRPVAFMRTFLRRKSWANPDR